MTACDCAYTMEGEGPPILLVHGIGAARDAWRFVVPHLIDRLSVISYDLRGHGESPLPHDEFGLEDLIADVERLRQRLHIDQWHVAGHSLGGMIGPGYARHYPQHVLSLGLFSTAAGRTTDDHSKVWGVVKAMEDKGIGQVLETLTDRWFTDDFISKNPDIVERRLQQVMDTSPNVFLNVFRIYASTEMMPWLHEVRHPSLIMTGEFDGGCNPRLNKLIHDAMPDSRLVILPDLKHSILTEAGQLVADRYGQFVEQLQVKRT